MPGDWDKSVHPDLADDAPAEQPPAPSARSSRGRVAETGGTGRPPTPPVDEAAPEPAPDAPDAAESQPSPDWFAQVREAKDPDEAIRLLWKNLPAEEFEKNQTISGLIGARAERRVKELQAKQERDAADRAKMEAAANNDLYTLGEMTQRELQSQLASQQAAQAAGPFMDGVVQFQKTLPETIQREIAGQAFGQGKSYAEGVAEYMAAIVDKAVELGVKKRESALRKSVMSEINGDEPVPERDSGTPGRVREVTDEMIAAMSLAEYEALFDENGRPKPGVLHRSTRGIPVHQQ